MGTSLSSVFETGLGDSRVRSLGWTETDFIIELAQPSKSDAEGSLRLCFQWVTNLRVDLNYGEYGGPPLVFSAERRSMEGGRWLIGLHFGGAPDGTITFECDSIAETPVR